MTHEDFISNHGLAFFAHRLRRVSELFTVAAGEMLLEQGIVTPPRAVSTVQLLHRDGPLAVTVIANILRFSHPLILKMVEQLVDLGLVTTAQDQADRRRRMVQLTPAGHDEAKRLALTNRAMSESYAEILGELDIDGLAMLEALEVDCRSGSFAGRLRTNLLIEENAS